MFLAGKASVSQSRSSHRRLAAVLWPIATAASLAGGDDFRHPLGRGQQTQGSSNEPPTFRLRSADDLDLPADTSPPSPWENRRLCQLVLEKGIDALPESSSHCVSGTPSVPREETYRSLLKQFLDNPTG